MMMMMNTTKAICVWPDTVGETNDDGSLRWIVSRDELDQQGRADTTHTLDVCDTEEEAMESAAVAAASACLPIYKNAENTPAERLTGDDLGREIWDAARGSDRRQLAAIYGDCDGWPTCECLCDCTAPAVTTDDGGTPVCDECETAVWTEDGDVICSRKTENFERCHVCGDKIDWGCIETHSPGTANSRTGTCGCGDAWLDEDKGGWGHYSYGVPGGRSS